MNDNQFALSFLDGLTTSCMKHTRQQTSIDSAQTLQTVKRMACLAFCNTTNGECNSHGECVCDPGK